MKWLSGGALAPALAWAQPTAALRLGVDGLIQDSGLAGHWKASMARDLGLSAQWVRSPSRQILLALESGALPVGLFLSHPLADQFDRQGLIHDRHVLARMAVLLVGPAQDPAGLKGESDLGRALHQILAGQAAGACRWEAPAPDSSLSGLAEPLLAPLGARSLPAAAASADSSAAAAAPYRFMTRADWQALPKNARQGLKVVVEGDPRLWLQCQVARSFRTPHAAGKLLVQWLQGPLARRAVGAPGSAWQAP